MIPAMRNFDWTDAYLTGKYLKYRVFWRYFEKKSTKYDFLCRLVLSGNIDNKRREQQDKAIRNTYRDILDNRTSNEVAETRRQQQKAVFWEEPTKAKVDVLADLI